jgi:LCP family protein required for cell wall assembly
MAKKHLTKHLKHHRRLKPRRHLWRRWSTWIILLFCLGLLGGAAYAKIKGTIVIPRADGNVPVALETNNADIDRLTKEGDSRLNILLLGQGGEGHSGASLTDTMQVMSLDLENKQAAILSIPRDLYIKSTYGSMKINAVYQAANSKQKNTGGQAAKDIAGKVTDLNLHYFLAVDFEGFVKLVDLLGGIDINAKNPINDYEYPNKTEDGYTTFKLAAGQHHLDGSTALKYARSRHSSGAEGSDFARSARQQQIISAIKDKAADQGYFKNPFKLVQLINLLANYVRTDMTPAEIKLLAEKLGGLETSSFQTSVLSNSETGLLVDGKIQGAGYTLVPRAGNSDYTDTGRLMHKLAPDPLIAKEAARILLEYPATKEKEATKAAALLTDYGYIVTEKVALPAGTKVGKQVVITDHRQKDPYTVHYLQNRFTALVEKGKTDRDDIDLTITLSD